MSATNFVSIVCVVLQTEANYVFFSNIVSQRLKKKEEKNAEWHHCVLKSRWILIPGHIQGELLAFEVYKKNPNYDLTANDEFSKTRNLNDVAVFKR